MLNIADHRIDGCWAGQSPNCGGGLIAPSLLVMHFTASGGDDPSGDVDWFLSRQAKASAHVVIGRDGTVRQVVPFDTKAWHAGVSIWRGRPNCNDYAIGIELDNWGPLVRAADGKVRSYTGAAVDPARAASLRHKHAQHDAWWELYPDAQLDSAAQVVRAILAAYPSIGEIVGHDDVSPGRKIDPGPAFPMARFTALVQGRSNRAIADRIVAVDRLNARGSAAADGALLGQFAAGARVNLLYDVPGAWAEVSGTLSDGRAVTAWVADRYLQAAGR